MKKLTDFFFYSSIFISLCAFGLVWETYLLLELPVYWPVPLLVSVATLFLYNLDNLLPYKTGQQMVLSARKKWLLQHRKSLLALVVSSGLAALGLFIFLLPKIPVWFILPLFGISIMYSLPVIPVKKGWVPLRDLPLLKVFLIALVWAGLTVGLPILLAGMPFFEAPQQQLLLRRFLFIFSLTLLFDIRDLHKDRLTHTLTFPGLFGTVFTKCLAGAALLLFIGLVHFQATGIARGALEISALVAGLVVAISSEKRSDLFFLVFADGMMLLQFLLVYLFLKFYFVAQNSGKAVVNILFAVQDLAVS